MSERHEGMFWQIETPDRKMPGHLDMSADASKVLDVLGRIFDERSNVVRVSPTGGVTVTMSGNAEDHIADFEPRTILGLLSDGTPVTLIEAQGGKTGGPILEYHQGFSARNVISGAHVEGVDQRYASIRFRVAGPPWVPRVSEAATADRDDVSVAKDENGRCWVEYVAGEPRTLHSFESEVLNPVTTLASLATQRDTEAIDVHVKIQPDATWLPVHSRRRGVRESHAPLVSTQLLDAVAFARWIDLRVRTDGLDAAVVDRLDGVAIQTQVLALASVAEGLHHRLIGETRRVASLGARRLDKARRAARQAAVAQIEGPGFTDEDRAEFEKAVNEAFAHINDQPFRSRMNDFASLAQEAVPGIVSEFADWPAAVTHARNVLAHQGTESRDDSEHFLNLLIALSIRQDHPARHHRAQRGREDGDDAELEDGDAATVSPARVMGPPVCHEHGTGCFRSRAVW